MTSTAAKPPTMEEIKRQAVLNRFAELKTISATARSLELTRYTVRRLLGKRRA